MQRYLNILLFVGSLIIGGVGCQAFEENPGRIVTARCYFGMGEDPGTLAATITETVATVAGQETFYVRLAMDPEFVDNTYGANAIGWENSKKGGHEFKELVGSDHAELKIYDGARELKAHFKLDYLSEVGDGRYRSLGVTDGDGEIFVGSPDIIVAHTTSMDRNFNEHGYSEYTVDSPLTDESYTENLDAAKWDYLVVYEVWVDAALFQDNGYGGAEVEYIHASPSKKSYNTIEVQEDDCPDTSWDENEIAEPEENEDQAETSQGPQPPVV